MPNNTEQRIADLTQPPNEYRGVSLDHEEWPFASPPLDGVRAFFEHHPACWAIDYRGACNCEYIKSLWRNFRGIKGDE